MVLENDLRQWPGGIHRPQHLVSFPRMLPHQGEFNFVKLGRFRQYLRGDGQFSDVVDGTRHPDAVDLLLGQAHFPGNGLGKFRNAELMSGRIGISRLDGGGHDLNGGGDRLLEIIEHVLELFFITTAFGDIHDRAS